MCRGGYLTATPQVFKTSSNISCLKKDSLQCSLCKNYFCETIVYVCSSGHIICKNCKYGDNKQDCGDNNKSRAVKKKSSTNKIKSPDLNLACGDHVEPVKSECAIEKKCSKNNEVNEIINNKIDKNWVFHNKGMTVVFKNLYYQDSTSSSDSCFNNNKDNVFQRCKSTARPIICPVSQCSKMVALDSISLHFYFDHSKIPRITINHTEAHKLKLKTTNITTETECIGILLTQKEKLANQTCHENTASRFEVSQDFESDNILLLMTARITTQNIKTKSKASEIFTQNNSTQTESFQMTTKIESPHVARVKDLKNKSSIVHEYESSDDDILMIWLCKFDDDNSIYSVTLCREDNRLSYTYTGEASHVRNKQDALSVYKRSECLQLRGIAVNRCIDSTKQTHVLIRIKNK